MDQETVVELLRGFEGSGVRVDITRDYPSPGTVLRDVEVLTVFGRGRTVCALLDEPRRQGGRGRGWVDASDVTAVEPSRLVRAGAEVSS